MALIECPRCGGKVSDHASACVRCGYTLDWLTTISPLDRNYIRSASFYFNKLFDYMDALVQKSELVFDRNAIKDSLGIFSQYILLKIAVSHFALSKEACQFISGTTSDIDIIAWLSAKRSMDIHDMQHFYYAGYKKQEQFLAECDDIIVDNTKILYAIIIGEVFFAKTAETGHVSERLESIPNELINLEFVPLFMAFTGIIGQTEDIAKNFNETVNALFYVPLLNMMKEIIEMNT